MGKSLVALFEQGRKAAGFADQEGITATVHGESCKVSIHRSYAARNNDNPSGILVRFESGGTVFLRPTHLKVAADSIVKAAEKAAATETFTVGNKPADK